LGDGITVNGISPGPTGTEMNAAVVKNSEANAQFLVSFPMVRWGKIEEIGALVCYPLIRGRQLHYRNGYSD
jgi:NAD(P)-dependent dehydrogenase (short-subunit alcohol dehydrogenase family)